MLHHLSVIARYDFQCMIKQGYKKSCNWASPDQVFSCFTQAMPCRRNFVLCCPGKELSLISGVFSLSRYYKVWRKNEANLFSSILNDGTTFRLYGASDKYYACTRRDRTPCAPRNTVPNRSCCNGTGCCTNGNDTQRKTACCIF